MFRGPLGVGKLVERGETLGKAGARVKAILSDRVVLQLRRGEREHTQVADLVVRLREQKGRWM